MTARATRAKTGAMRAAKEAPVPAVWATAVQKTAAVLMAAVAAFALSFSPVVALAAVAALAVLIVVMVALAAMALFVVAEVSATAMVEAPCSHAAPLAKVHMFQIIITGAQIGVHDYLYRFLTCAAGW